MHGLGSTMAIPHRTRTSAVRRPLGVWPSPRPSSCRRCTRAGSDLWALASSVLVGFAVLAAGSWSGPAFAAGDGGTAAVWGLVATGVAFVVAGARSGHSPAPARHGAAAACVAYLLVVLLRPGHPGLTHTVVIACCALLVGGITGALAHRWVVAADLRGARHRS